MEQQELAIEIAKIKTRLDSTDQRMANVEQTIKRIESLTISVEKLAFSVENMAKEQVKDRTSQNELAKRLLEVEQAPVKNKADKADHIVMKIIELLLAGLVGFLLTYCFKM